MDNNIIDEAQLKSSDDRHHEMQMMMMTAMMQNIPNDYNNNLHHHDHHDNASPPFMNLHSQPLISLHQDQPLFLSGSSTAGNSVGGANNYANKRNGSSMAAMREMIFRMAVMQPVHIDPESVKPPKRRNVRISKDPQSVAARHRRERISERIRILQRLVPGGTKMDTASMLDEAIHYVKFLKTQVQSLERVSAANISSNNNTSAARPSCSATGMGFPVPMSTGAYSTHHHHHHHHHAVKGFAQNGTQQHYGDVFD